MKTPMKTFALATATLGLAFSTVPAFAASGATDLPQAELTFDDLDLSTPSGQKALDRRIDKLARSICGADTVTTGSRILSNSREIKNCVKTARASAERQIAAIIEDQQRGG